MKDTMQPTSKELAETFKNEFRHYGFDKDEHDAALQMLADICLKHGLQDTDCIMKVMDFSLRLELYGLFGSDEERSVEEIQFGKDLATITSIFKNGRGIKIHASMPDGDFKERPIDLKIETNGLLQKLAFLSFSTLLAHCSFLYEWEYITEKKEDFLPDFFKASGLFKEPYSDKELAKIIEYEDGWLATKKAMMGRPRNGILKEIPKLGYMVHGFIEAGGDGLAALGTFERYILIGDLMLAAGVSPVEQVEWEEVLTNKDKADKVKSWEASYLNAIGK